MSMEPLTQINCLEEMTRLYEAGRAAGGINGAVGLGDCVLFYSPDLNGAVSACFTIPPERTLARRLGVNKSTYPAIYPVPVPNWPKNTWRIQMLDFNPKGTE